MGMMGDDADKEFSEKLCESDPATLSLYKMY